MDLKEKIIEILNNDSSTLASIMEENHAIDIAILLEDFSNDELNLFSNKVSVKDMASILEQSEEDLQIRILNQFNVGKIVKIFEHMSNDDIADCIGNLKIDLRKELLLHMKQSSSRDVNMLLGYEKDSAGGIMTTQYVALKSNYNMTESILKIKHIAPKTEVIDTIFVLDNNNKLVGVVDLREILIAPDNSKLSEIMEDNFISVFPDMDQEEVSLLVSKYDLKSIPVVNKKGSIIGIITVDDIIDVIVEEQTEDLLMMSGVSKDERVDSKVSTAVTKRLPWLFINLFTAFLASSVVGVFQNVIEQVVALAVAMPIVAGMGGNAGTQTLSIVIRSIALGEIDTKEELKLAIKEIIVGVINGLAIGLVTGSILALIYKNIYLGIIMLVAMICNLLIAGFFGFTIPILLKKLNLDPALSSSIFLTTATDVGGFFVFLGLAKLFLPLLL